MSGTELEARAELAQARRWQVESEGKEQAHQSGGARRRAEERESEEVEGARARASEVEREGGGGGNERQREKREGQRTHTWLTPLPPPTHLPQRANRARRGRLRRPAQGAHPAAAHYHHQQANHKQTTQAGVTAEGEPAAGEHVEHANAEQEGEQEEGGRGSELEGEHTRAKVGGRWGVAGQPRGVADAGADGASLTRRTPAAWARRHAPAPARALPPPGMGVG
jgi:hypothetical protein